MTDSGTDGDTWADLVGPFYDAATMAAVLSVSVSAVRGRRARGSLLALRTGNCAWVYPAWQLHGGQVLPGLVIVFQVLAAHVSGWTAAAWLRSPDVELGGRTPLQVLQAGGEDDLVLLVASHAASGWA